MKKKHSAKGRAWERARSYGIDMELLADQLKLTVAERTARHAAARSLAVMMRGGVKTGHG